MMMKQVLQIRCKNNKKSLKVPIGSTLSDIYKENNLQMTFGPVSAKVNNKVEGLHYRVYHNKDVEYLDLHAPSGIRTYTRSLFLVLCKAVHDLYRLLLQSEARTRRYARRRAPHPHPYAGNHRCPPAHTAF